MERLFWITHGITVLITAGLAMQGCDEQAVAQGFYLLAHSGPQDEVSEDTESRPDHEAVRHMRIRSSQTVLQTPPAGQTRSPVLWALRGTSASPHNVHLLRHVLSFLPAPLASTFDLTDNSITPYSEGQLQFRSVLTSSHTRTGPRSGGCVRIGRWLNRGEPARAIVRVARERGGILVGVMREDFGWTQRRPYGNGISPEDFGSHVGGDGAFYCPYFYQHNRGFRSLLDDRDPHSGYRCAAITTYEIELRDNQMTYWFDGRKWNAPAEGSPLEYSLGWSEDTPHEEGGSCSDPDYLTEKQCCGEDGWWCPAVNQWRRDAFTSRIPAEGRRIALAVCLPNAASVSLLNE